MLEWMTRVGLVVGAWAMFAGMGSAVAPPTKWQQPVVRFELVVAEGLQALPGIRELSEEDPAELRKYLKDKIISQPVAQLHLGSSAQIAIGTDSPRQRYEMNLTPSAGQSGKIQVEFDMTRFKQVQGIPYTMSVATKQQLTPGKTLVLSQLSLTGNNDDNNDWCVILIKPTYVTE